MASMWLCVYECVLLPYFQPNSEKKKSFFLQEEKELRIWVSLLLFFEGKIWVSLDKLFLKNRLLQPVDIWAGSRLADDSPYLWFAEARLYWEVGPTGPRFWRVPVPFGTGRQGQLCCWYPQRQTHPAACQSPPPALPLQPRRHPSHR
jgi:hypothetical protein